MAGVCPDLGRLVEVRCPARARGTGFLVADNLVLTAAHVVAASSKGAGVQVRLFDAVASPDAQWVQAHVVPAGDAAEALDVAVLQVTGMLPKPVTPAPEWGRIVKTAPIRVFAVCFPRVMKDGSGIDSHVVRGMVEPAQGARRFAAGGATLTITEGSIVPKRDASGASPWSGASGAAVFASHTGQLVGVLTDDFDIAQDASVLSFTLVARVQGLVGLVGASIAPVASDSLNMVVPVPQAAAVDAPGWPVRPRGGVGAPPEVFIGREAELAALDTALAAGAGVITQTRAVTGLGGIGKSTLAARWIADRDTDFNPIWWINAENPAQIGPSLAELARELHPGLKSATDVDAAAWCRDWLRSHDGWLLVLDNVTAPGDVQALIKDCPRGRFLLTSRTTVGWKDVATPTRLSVLPPDDAVELLRRLAGQDWLDGAGQLCEALGFLPLGIELAAAYMEETGVSASTYLRLLTTSQNSEVLAWKPIHGDAQRTVARIWQVSLDQISAHFGDLPARLLQVLAWYAPDDIPLQVLQAIDWLDETEANEALGRLAAYALLTRGDKAVSAHRLVQAVARTSGNGANATANVARDAAVQALLAALPHWAQPHSWPTWRRIMPHIDALAVHVDFDDDDEHLARLLAQAALFLQEQGTPARAIPLFQRALAGRERVLGPDHPKTLASRNNLASAYRSAGDPARAIPLFQRALADWERVLGPDHRKTLASRNNLASAYRWAGDLDRALPIYEQTLADRERLLGAEHRDTLISRNNLAGAYRSAGDLGRAILLFEANLAVRERVLGSDHRNTLTSRSNLAYAYESAGDLVRAIPLFEQTLADRERVLGPDHPETLISRNNLAHAYESAGDLVRAIPIYERALADCVRVLGPDHPKTRIVLRNWKAVRGGAAAK